MANKKETDAEYKKQLEKIYDVLAKIMNLKSNPRSAFVFFVIRDLDDPEGNIDTAGNIPDNIAIQILEETINTIVTRTPDK